MDSRFGRNEKDLDPPSEPISLLAKIMSDPTQAAETSSDKSSSEGEIKKRSDYFYIAWDKFLALEPGRAKSLPHVAKHGTEEEAGASDGGVPLTEKVSTSWERAAAACRKRAEAIVTECKRLNQKYRDSLFDLDETAHCLTNLAGVSAVSAEVSGNHPWVKRVEDIFDDPKFFIDGASPTDVHQGSTGDCWFLAALMSISVRKELVEHVCVARDERIGVYGFVFYRDGEWIHEVIDDKLYIRVGDHDDIHIVRNWRSKGQKESSVQHDEGRMRETLQQGPEALYFAHCNSNETWLPLLEKAYAKAHGNYRSIEGGWASEGIEDLTGGVSVTIDPRDIMDKERFWQEQLTQVNEKYLFGAITGEHGKKGIVGCHAYAVLRTWEEGDLKLLKVRNPWGETEWEGDWSDGSKLWTGEMMMKLDHKFGDDGVFWMSYEDFLKHLPYMNRVQQFNDEWRVAQQWTSVNVPWTVDYLDTKFQSTVDRRSPVVLVLSQPDRRYWSGLWARFDLALHFKICKEGEEDGPWVTRSMHRSSGYSSYYSMPYTRSVCAEIEDSEPGTYTALVKITASRYTKRDTQAELITKYALTNKKKLLDAGRKFDYANAKGDLRGLEKAHQTQAKRRQWEKDVVKLKSARKTNKQARERKRKCQERINVAMREKKTETRRRQKEEKMAKEARKAGQEIGKETNGAETNADGKNSDGASPKVQPGDVTVAGAGEPAEGHVDPRERANEEKAEQRAKEQDVGSVHSPEPASSDKSGSKKEDEGKGGDEDDDEDDSIDEDPEKLEDDDFDWDSDLDAPPLKTEDDGYNFKVSASSDDNEIFAKDPWNAMCVLGLRVYAKGAEAKVKVVRGKGDA